MKIWICLLDPPAADRAEAKASVGGSHASDEADTRDDDAAVRIRQRGCDGGEPAGVGRVELAADSLDAR
jgi:hypothetical protein